MCVLLCNEIFMFCSQHRFACNMVCGAKLRATMWCVAHCLVAHCKFHQLFCVLLHRVVCNVACDTKLCGTGARMWCAALCVFDQRFCVCTTWCAAQTFVCNQLHLRFCVLQHRVACNFVCAMWCKNMVCGTLCV